MVIVGLLNDMAPPAKVTANNAISVILEFFDQFNGDVLPVYSDNIWKVMAAKVTNAWSSHCWFVNVTNDRRQILTAARKRMGLEALNSSPQASFVCYENTHHDSTLQTSDSELDNESWFEFVLSSEIWDEIKPVETDGKRTNYTLRAKVWTNIIADEFWKQFRLPCAYLFKRADVNTSENRKHFLQIQGRCSNKKCGNRFNGHAHSEPCENTGELRINVRTRDTSQEPHAIVKRPLNGIKRKRMGRAAFGEGSNNLTKRLKREHLKRGETDGPTIPKSNAVLHAKKEFVEEDLGAKKAKGEDIIQAIYRLGFENPYSGSIHDLGYNPFYAFYGTSEQRTVYKKYRHLHINSASVSADATGSVVRKIVQPSGLKSAHIFLYCLVVHFDNTSLPVYQMLSESQENEKIEFWLRTWLRTVDFQKPRQIVVDYSAAMVLACCLAFNNINVKKYISICFDAASSGRQLSKELITTFIRIDVAHLIHLVCRWKCLKTHPIPVVRDFFVRCVGMMIDCQSFEDFTDIFLMTCAVALHEHDDTQLQLKSLSQTIKTPKEAREKLESMMQIRPLDVNLYFKIQQQDVPDQQEASEVADTNISNVNSFFTGLKAEATFITIGGRITNHYRLTAFVEPLIRIGKQFPLWTAACIPYYTGHPTSSYVERTFKDIKREVFKNHQLPQSADKFLKVHIKDLLGGTRSFESKMSDFQMQGHSIQEFKPKQDVANSPLNEEFANQIDSIDSALKSEENWRNKAESHIRFKAPNQHETECNKNDFQNSFTEFLSLSDLKQESMQYDSLLEEKIENIYIPATSTPEHCNEANDAEKNENNAKTYPASKHEVTAEDKEPTFSKNGPSQSKFFRSYPEMILNRITSSSMTHKNAFKNKSTERYVLQNGFRCGTVKLHGSVYTIRNTCPFDVVVQLLLSAAVDDSNYFKFVHSEENDVFKLIKAFIEEGPTATIYEMRFKMLQPFFEHTKAITGTKNHELVTSYDATGSPADIWKNFFETTPSLFRSHDCAICGKIVSCDVSLVPNHKIILQQGFKCLQKALTFSAKMYDVSCECGKNYTQELLANHHVFVELEIRASIQSAIKICRLKDLPTTLMLTTQYRFVTTIR